MEYIDINSITPATITWSDSTTGCNSTSITNTYTNYCNCHRGERTNKMKYFDNETMKIWKLLNPDYKVSIDFSTNTSSISYSIEEEYMIIMSKGTKELKRCISSTQLSWSRENNQYISLEILNDMKKKFEKGPVKLSSGDVYTEYLQADLISLSYCKKRNEHEIKKIVCNPSKNATTVIFKDGDVVVVKKSPEDPESDIFSVVAYAVAKHVYGSNSAFKREVLKDLDFIDKEFDKVMKNASIEDLTEALRRVAKSIKKKNEEAKK